MPSWLWASAWQSEPHEIGWVTLSPVATGLSFHPERYESCDEEQK